MLDSTILVFLSLLAIALLTQSQWLFFLSIAALVLILHVRQQQAAAREEARKKAVEKAKHAPKRKIIVVREPHHETITEKFPQEIANEIAEKTVFHSIHNKIGAFKTH